MTGGSLSFPEGFLWGTATSAYQIEGAAGEDGRGPSIWDTFSHATGRTLHGDTGDIACDHYHRFREDVALMADLGVGAYRFSIAWPRIQPEGTGPPNARGLDFYRRLIDELRARDIAPVATLFHWDLPQALEDRGGWPSRETADRFGEYAGIVAQALDDGVEMWITLNEPWVAGWLGYGDGIHAPGRSDIGAALGASHHLMLAHARAMEALRRTGAAECGITLNFQPVSPASPDPDDVRVTELADQQMNRLYLDLLFGRGYPSDLVDHYRHVSDFGFVLDGDLEAIARPIDFLGVNYYTRESVTAHPRPEHRAHALAGDLGAWSFVPPGIAVTAMGWAVEPDGLSDLLLRLHRDYPAVPLYVTENGAAFPDYVDPEGGVHDLERIEYLRKHLAAAHRAMGQGVALHGYFVWSLLDNFEWAEGYSKRFGLIHVDFGTQRRTPKASARWYRRVVTGAARD